MLAIGWEPVVDGTVLPETPFDPAAPAQSAGIPFLVGNTFHEFVTGIDKPHVLQMTWEQLSAQLTRRSRHGRHPPSTRIARRFRQRSRSRLRG